ncbi:hypothetical protein [Paramicrobacterium agarici]|uniref:hypothetical protein n=1 Tax=Paramicrobacterium agarici TaxID=630514 RepID=UPI00114D64A9|nr:hypothetical protein [Microbacterium agarici]TQO21813.1 hypothetical protein FB385_0625 [Microbacterium agarici]
MAGGEGSRRRRTWREVGLAQKTGAAGSEGSRRRRTWRDARLAQKAEAAGREGSRRTPTWPSRTLTVPHSALTGSGLAAGRREHPSAPEGSGFGENSVAGFGVLTRE